jgi:hypothetical protein
MRPFVHRIQNLSLKKEATPTFPPCNIMPYATHDLEFDRDFIEHEQVYSFDPCFHDADIKTILEQRYSIDVDLCDLMQTMKLDVSCEKGVRLTSVFLGSNDS